jgi:lipid-binding SYLF domain-containing protein
LIYEKEGLMKKLLKAIFLQSLFIAALISLTSCAGWDPDREQREADQIKMTIEQFMQQDPGLKVFFDKAHGYAVFPSVGKGAYILGGTYGNGLVYEKGNLIGFTTIVEASVGLQIGGQAFSEIIFFKDESALDHFKRGNFEFSAQASVVAVNQGVAAQTAYNEGIAIFILPKGGLMADVSAGGQKFTYEPK